MRTLLTGGTGYLGRHLVAGLGADGHALTVISRGGRSPFAASGVHVIEADPTRQGDWQRAVDGMDVVVNLAGAPLVDPPKRWTATRKRMLRASRIDTTERVVEAIRDADRPPAVLVSGSAVGYYGDGGETVLTEAAEAGDDFLARLCRDWEAAALDAASATRVVLLRTAPVVGPDAPLLAPMLLPFRLGLGGPWGTGRQWWPWVHVDDVVELVRHTLDGDVTGPLNVAAPEPVRVDTFAKALARVLGRPAMFRAPAAMLRLALGEAADALLVSQRVVPQRALAGGYAFRQPDLGEALAASV